MNSKALSILEFNKIIDMLCELCPTEGAKHLARQLSPATDEDKVRKLLLQTGEAKKTFWYQRPSFFRISC